MFDILSNHPNNLTRKLACQSYLTFSYPNLTDDLLSSSSYNLCAHDDAMMISFGKDQTGLCKLWTKSLLIRKLFNASCSIHHSIISNVKLSANGFQSHIMLLKLWLESSLSRMRSGLQRFLDCLKM